MAGNNINIVISLKNQASGPLKEAKKDFGDFRNSLVQFNRRLFTAAAVYQTFHGVFAKAFDMAEVGADFDFFRQQFDRTFDSGYLKTLRTASKGTMDAMSMMQIATQNHARGLKQAETEKIFTLSVGAAKLLKTSTVDAAKQMSKALQTLSVSGMQQFMVALNTNNQFKNMDLMLKRLTKGLNAAGMETNNFRKNALRELEIALGGISAQSGDAKTLFMSWSAGITSLRDIVGSLLSRALAPLMVTLTKLTWDIFDKLDDVLNNVSSKMKIFKAGLVSVVQYGGAIIGTLTAIAGAFSLLTLVCSALSIPITAVIAGIGFLALGLKTMKNMSGGWIEAFSNIGTTLEFWWKALSTYDEKTGKMQGTQDLVDRIKNMSPGLRGAVVTIGEGFALASVAMHSFTGELSAMWDTIKSIGKSVYLDKILGFLFNTKQFGNGAQAFAKIAGATTAGAAIGGVAGAPFGGIGALPGAIAGGLMGGFGEIGRINAGGKTAEGSIPMSDLSAEVEKQNRINQIKNQYSIPSSLMESTSADTAMNAENNAKVLKDIFEVLSRELPSNKFAGLGKPNGRDQIRP